MIFTTYKYNYNSNESVFGHSTMQNWKEEIEKIKMMLSEGIIDAHEFYKRKEEILSKASSESTYYEQADVERTEAFHDEDNDDDDDDFHLNDVDSVFKTEFDHPRELGQYRVLDQIGEGGMGIIYRGRHKVEEFARRTGDVAIKIMRERFAQNEGFRNRFIAEASFGRSISHPNIVRIYDVLLDKGRLALVMDLVEGISLHTLIPKEGMSIHQTLDIITPLCHALDHLHAEGIVHRDLKPENIILTPEGSPVLLDMGIAKGEEDSQFETSTGTSIGTPAYMAPEQIDAKRVTGAADRYALGLVMYRLLTCGFPWRKGTSRGEIISHKFMGLLVPPKKKEIPKHVKDAIMKLLHQDPEERFDTCKEFLEAIHSIPIPAASETNIPTSKHQVFEPEITEDSIIEANSSDNINIQNSSEKPKVLETFVVSAEDTINVFDETVEPVEVKNEINQPINPEEQPVQYFMQIEGDVTVSQLRSFSKLRRMFSKEEYELKQIAQQHTLTFTKIPSGEYWMGANNGDHDERPKHQIQLTSPFYISNTLITQAMWEILMGDNPSKYPHPNNPVERVSWFSCINFCNLLSEMHGHNQAYTFNGSSVICDFDSDGYRLPTEAEWAAAARSNNTLYSGSDNIEEVGWHSGNSQKQPQPVAQKNPNQFGLFDMTGNVWEWCFDWYAPKTYHEKNRINPTGPSKGTKRVSRGGAWNSVAKLSRVSIRSRSAPKDNYSTVGFRLARSIATYSNK
jgi:formylglycine-generating enzyme